VLYELLTGATALEARSFAEGVANDPEMTAQAFLVAVASSRATYSIDPSKDPHLKHLRSQKNLMQLLQAMTARDRNSRLSSSGLEAAVRAILEGRKPNLATTQTGRLTKQGFEEDTQKTQYGQAILLLASLAIGFVVLLGAIIGYTVFFKSKDSVRPDNKAASSEKTPNDEKSRLANDPKPREIYKKPHENPRDPGWKTIQPKPAKGNPSSFFSKYEFSSRSGATLDVTETTLTNLELTYLARFRLGKLILHITELSPEAAKALSQSKAMTLVFSGLRSISPSNLKWLSAYRGRELIFSNLDTISLESATNLYLLRVRVLKFGEFKTQPSLETLATAASVSVLNSRRIKIEWAAKTNTLMKEKHKEISTIVLRKFKERSRAARRPRYQPKHPSTSPSDQFISMEIQSGHLTNIGELTRLLHGIPALLLKFANLQGKKELNLSKIKDLTPSYAKILADFKGRLILSSLYDIDELAAVLSKFKGPLLDLSGARGLSREALKHLSKAETTLILGDHFLSQEDLQILTNSKLKGLVLSGLTDLRDEQLECLAKSQISLLKLDLSVLSVEGLRILSCYKGTLDFLRIDILSPEWIPVLKCCEAREIRFTALKVFSKNAARVMRDDCSSAERARLWKLLKVPEAFTERLRVALGQ
ncbi:MAG: hypothetical protein P1V97_08820, partial [Planctomycetota bacterium]|nr:hypothetical protein [Planctomycetota bacterium]